MGDVYNSIGYPPKSKGKKFNDEKKVNKDLMLDRPGSVLSVEEDAATRRFLENVNKWRKANSMEEVTNIFYNYFQNCVNFA